MTTEGNALLFRAMHSDARPRHLGPRLSARRGLGRLLLAAFVFIGCGHAASAGDAETLAARILALGGDVKAFGTVSTSDQQGIWRPDVPARSANKIVSFDGTIIVIENIVEMAADKRTQVTTFALKDVDIVSAGENQIFSLSGSGGHPRTLLFNCRGNAGCMHVVVLPQAAAS